MYNYHADLVWSIDIAITIAIIALTLGITLYAVIGSYFSDRRNRSLLKIKRNIYEYMISGQTGADNVCPPFNLDSTPQQFLDIATNRNRGVIFFNDSEQQLFKKCFVPPEKITKFEKIAASGWNKWRRIEAILSLGYAGSAKSIKTLKRSLYSKDEDVSYFSIVALGQIKTIESAKTLLEFMRKSKYTRYKIASVLEGFPAGIADDVIQITEDADPSARIWALRLLMKIKPKKYLDRIKELTEDGSDDVRGAACECLGEFDGPAVKDVLAGCLKDDYWLVRANAVKALSKSLGDACMPYIIEMLNDGSLTVISSVKDAMASHIAAAMPYISRIFAGEDGVAKRTAVEALDESGYIIRALKDILSGSPESMKYAFKMLNEMAAVGAHLSIEAAIGNLDNASRSKLFEIIFKADPKLSEYLVGRMSKTMGEI